MCIKHFHRKYCLHAGCTVPPIYVLYMYQHIDYSHAHTFWRSPAIEIFIKLIIQDLLTKKITDPEVIKKKIDTVRRMEAKVSEQLQLNEGRMRSHLIKTINFRRVPRLLFESDTSIKILVEKLQHIHNVVK